MLEPEIMDELILLELEGRATADERDKVRRWRQAAEDHEHRYKDIRAIWLLLGQHQEIGPIKAVPSVETLLRRGRWAWRSRRYRELWLNRVAAVAAVLIIALGLGHMMLGARANRIVTAEFRGGPGELTTAVLHDGSVARLAPNTTLRAVFDKHQRVVDLDGRAFFAVASDPERPFRVQTAKGEARVLGTRFEVDTGSNGLRLLVVDGKVALTAAGVETELASGELAQVSAEAPLSITHVEAPEALLDWMGAWVAFEATPLWKVVRDLEVRLGLEIEIVDSTIAERTVSGWFSHEDRGRILSMICRVADIQCMEEAGTIYMRNRVR